MCRTLRFSVVLPALMLNYLGHGALLLRDPSAAENPFYKLSQEWALYPMVALATTATVIASQAVISGAYSATRQAIQLGYLPRMAIRHTSQDTIGQIYVPFVNAALMVTTIGLVLGSFIVYAAIPTILAIGKSDYIGLAGGLSYAWLVAPRPSSAAPDRLSTKPKMVSGSTRSLITDTGVFLKITPRSRSTMGVGAPRKAISPMIIAPFFLPRVRVMT